MDEQDTAADRAAQQPAVDASAPVPAAKPVFDLDLEAIAADLADVETALARLEAGTYFTDEVTGEPLPEDFLIANPTARTFIPAPAT
jgi:RNA polymerase-binding transcription factor DksA